MAKATYRDATGAIVTRKVHAIVQRVQDAADPDGGYTILIVTHPDSREPVRECVADRDWVA